MSQKRSPTADNEVSSAENEEFNRLFWNSRRGMLELDLLLVPFLKEAYRDLSLDDQARFKNLLTCEDPDLFSWFMQNTEPDNPNHARIIKIILDRVQPN
jgi:antitoxin CptB